MKTPILKHCLFAIATVLLSVSSSCKSSSSSPSEGQAGSAAKGGSGGKAGRGGKAGSGGAGASGSADGGTQDDASVDGGSGSAGRAGSSGKTGSGGSGAKGGTGGAAGSGSDQSGTLFDPDVLQRFDITLPAASQTALNANPATYTHASLKYGNTTLADVAIRIKGESSKRTLDQKAAFKIKLDEYSVNQTLLGLKRITLNNMVSDRTFMAECLAYTVYRAANLPAPRCNHAIVYVNDDFYGVYTNVESEDKTFLKRWFSNVDGNLYEDGQSDFVDNNEASFDLQTNETANDRSDLTKLISAIDNAKSTTYLSDLDSILDTTHYLHFTAVEAAVDQWDGYSNTYYEPNNYRIYHDLSTGKFTFLPWGHDLSMKAFGDNPEVALTTSTEYIPLFQRPLYEDKAGARDAGGRIFVGDRAGDRASGGCLDSTTCKDQYAKAVREVMALYDTANLTALAGKMYKLIKPYVYMEETGRREISNEDFEAAHTRLLTHISNRTAEMDKNMTAEGYTK